MSDTHPHNLDLEQVVGDDMDQLVARLQGRLNRLYLVLFGVLVVLGGSLAVWCCFAAGLTWWAGLLWGFCLSGGPLLAVGVVCELLLTRGTLRQFHQRYPDGSPERTVALAWVASGRGAGAAGRLLRRFLEQGPLKSLEAERLARRRDLDRIDAVARQNEHAPRVSLDPLPPRPPKPTGSKDITTDPRGDHPEGVRADE
jgi:hypothetical protein